MSRPEETPPTAIESLIASTKDEIINYRNEATYARLTALAAGVGAAIAFGLASSEISSNKDVAKYEIAVGVTFVASSALEFSVAASSSNRAALRERALLDHQLASATSIAVPINSAQQQVIYPPQQFADPNSNY